MRVLKRSPWLGGLGLMLASLALSTGPALADVTTDQPGSIVVYPKVIADGTRDTLIQLANTSNVTRYVHCIYLNGAGACETNSEVVCSRDSECPDFAGGERCELLWQEQNFGLVLTSQQPTVWQVSTGRVVNPTDPANGTCSNTCSDSGATCSDASDCEDGESCRGSCPGIDPGAILPAPAQPFRGELKCVQVDESDAPVAGNSLKGEALIVSSAGQVSGYNAVAIQGVAVDQNLALSLNNTEYNACPTSIEFVHHANLASDSVAAALDPSLCDTTGICVGGTNPGTPCAVGGSDCTGVGAVCNACPVRAELTLVPCTENFENRLPLSFMAQFLVFDEQEYYVSASDPVTCWYNSGLSDIGMQGVAFSASRGAFLRTTVTTGGLICIAGANLGLGCSDDDDCGTAALGGVCGPTPGLLGVVEEFYDTDASIDPQLVGAGRLARFAASAASTMRISKTSRSGVCRGNTATPCTSDADCATGLCRKDGVSCTSNDECSNVGNTAGLNRCDKCLIDSIDIPELVPFPAPTPAP